MRIQHIAYILVLSAFVACAPKAAKDMTAKTADMPAKAGDFRATAPVAGPARPIEIGSFEEFTLANGLKVIVVENHKLPQVSYSLTIDRDPIMEGEKSGLSGIAGSLLATGTTGKTKAQIDDAVDFLGANLSTGGTGGFASSLTKHTDKILALFSEVILSPSFPEAEFDKLKTQTLSGLQTEKDDPNAISGNVSKVLTYGKDHPYGEITNEITVSNLTLDDCKQYYQTYFQPGNSYLVIVGDITPADAKAKAEKYFGKWAAGHTPVNKYHTPKPVDKTEVAFVDKAGAVQSVINVIQPIELQPGQPDVIPANVMNTILGSGFSGRLFKNLREDKAYTYGAYSSLNTDKLVGSFSASASVRNEVTDSAVVQFLYELNRMRDEPVTDSELELAKNFIAGGFARSLESPRTVANFALNMNMYNLPKDYYETYLQKLAAVTVSDIQRVARKYVQPEHARIVVVGNKDAVMDKLARFDMADGKVQEYDIYGNEKKAVKVSMTDMSVDVLMDRYFDAIGGFDKVVAVKSMDQSYSMELMGMQMTTRQVVDNGKFFMSMTAPGMNIMQQVFDGTQAKVESMGQVVPVDDNMLAELRKQTYAFPELMYGKDGFKAEIKGTDDVDGNPCYKVVVTDPDGGSSTVYYDMQSSFKRKEVQVQEQGGQVATTTIEYSDYKQVDGLLIPHTITISGPMPTPMVMKATNIQVNPKVDPDLFKI